MLSAVQNTQNPSVAGITDVRNKLSIPTTWLNFSSLFFFLYWKFKSTNIILLLRPDLKFHSKS